MAGDVSFKSIVLTKWEPETEKKLDLAMLQMATDIHRGAVILAPVDKGGLVASARIQRVSSAFYQIIFGGGKIPYAKRRHYENKAHPGTLKYLQRAGDSVARNNFKKYLSL